jgi:proteasome lid subunit RPN8/RPN11
VKEAAVVITRSIRAAIVRHARVEQPRECCGLLLGDGPRILYAVPTPNVATRPTRFRVDDRTHIELRRVLRGLVPPLSVTGVYHSHPEGPPVPSDRDVAEAMYPGWTYLIASLAGRSSTVRAFRIARGRVIERRIQWR